jgi:hypothetical protein
VDLSSPPKSLFFRWKLRRAQGPTTQAVRQAAERTSPHARNRGLHHHRPRRTVQSLPSDRVYAHWQNRTRLRHPCSRRRFSHARSKRRVVLHEMDRRPPRADCAARNPSSNPLRRRTSSSCGTRKSTPAPNSLSCSPLPALPSTGPCRGLARRSQCGRPCQTISALLSIFAASRQRQSIVARQQRRFAPRMAPLDRHDLDVSNLSQEAGGPVCLTHHFISSGAGRPPTS